MSLIDLRSFLFILLIGFQAFNSVCQTGNPFEIRETRDSKGNFLRDSNSKQLIDSSNPFVLREAKEVESIKILEDVRGQILDWVHQPEDKRIKRADVQSLLFWSLLFLCFLLAIALNINRSVTLKLYRSLLNLNFLSLLYRESKEENLLIYYLLYGLYFIGLSLFIYLSVMNYNGLKSPIYILYISMYIMLIYGLRHFSLKLIGFIYGVNKEADRYLFSIVISSCIMSILLIPADFIIAFVNPALGRKCIWLIFIVFVILYLYRQFREIIFSVNLWRQHIFHFLLYLCTFEIMPLTLCIIFLQREGVI